MNKKKRWFDNWNTTKKMSEVDTYTLTLPHAHKPMKVTFKATDKHFRKMKKLWDVADSALSRVSQQDQLLRDTTNKLHLIAEELRDLRTRL